MRGSGPGHTDLTFFFWHSPLLREIFLSFGGYDPSASARRLAVPLRAINGDLYPTDVGAVRTIKGDFEVVLMRHMGHYPMLERPVEFDRLVAEVVERLTGAPQG